MRARKFDALPRCINTTPSLFSLSLIPLELDTWSYIWKHDRGLRYMSLLNLTYLLGRLLSMTSIRAICECHACWGASVLYWCGSSSLRVALLTFYCFWRPGLYLFPHRLSYLLMQIFGYHHRQSRCCSPLSWMSHFHPMGIHLSRVFRMEYLWVCPGALYVGIYRATWF